VIRAVLDANVFISGVYGPGGTPGMILSHWARRRFEVIISEHIIEEIARNLRKPYFERIGGSSKADVLVRQIRAFADVVVPDIGIEGAATHAEDDNVLSAAVFAGADFLVTGDRGFLAMGSYEGVRIISPRDFLTFLELQPGAE
jgi:putative PIN family toxin of toxin-antitoxin system